MSRLTRHIGVLLIIGAIFLLNKTSSHAIEEFTGYKHANTVETEGNPGFNNLQNCKSTDALTCDRPYSIGHANLYFMDFDDFDIPSTAIISAVRIRVTGKTTSTMNVGISGIRNTPDNCLGGPFVTIPANTLNGQTLNIFETSQDYNYGSISGCLSKQKIADKNYAFYIRGSWGWNWSANIDNFEVGFLYDIDKKPEPETFLELPWDYESQGRSFDNAAMNINSYFDHQYPFYDSEPLEFKSSTISYNGNSVEYYSGHDGYDWGRDAGVQYKDPVLAAASGSATFDNSCSDCGNRITIDHGNGYKTSYYHLFYDEGLITNIPNNPVHVSKGQQIGLVGLTGRTDGPHIHFLVLHDKDNLNFKWPDTLTDPFGWKSEESDPWETYPTGNKSDYLWIHKLSSDEEEITPLVPKEILFADILNLSVPAGSKNELYKMYLDVTPAEEPGGMKQLGTAVRIIAKDSSGNLITNFDKDLEIKFDLSNLDYTNTKPSELSIFSKSNGSDWVKEETTIDSVNQTAIAYVNHLSDFALFAEKIDDTPPTTTDTISGQAASINSYYPNIQLSLDSADPSGVEYTAYNIGNGWNEYIGPITITDPGSYVLQYYSGDNYGNTENLKTKKLNIVEIPAELKINYDKYENKIVFSPLYAPDSSSLNRSEVDENTVMISLSNYSNNILNSSINYNDLKFKDTVEVDSIKYNDNEEIDLDPNKFSAKAKFDKDNNLTDLKQEYWTNDNKKIMLQYSNKDNLTRITEFSDGGEIKTSRNGLTLLYLYTERGELKYKY